MREELWTQDSSPTCVPFFVQMHAIESKQRSIWIARRGFQCLVAVEEIQPGVPPQNPIQRTIVDVSALGVKLAYPDA